MKTLEERNELADKVSAELTRRGEQHNPADVFGFVGGCWPTDSTADELADQFVEQRNAE